MRDKSREFIVFEFNARRVFMAKTLLLDGIGLAFYARDNEDYNSLPGRCPSHLVIDRAISSKTGCGHATLLNFWGFGRTCPARISNPSNLRGLEMRIGSKPALGTCQSITLPCMESVVRKFRTTGNILEWPLNLIHISEDGEH